MNPHTIGWFGVALILYGLGHAVFMAFHEVRVERDRLRDELARRTDDEWRLRGLPPAPRNEQIRKGIG